MGKESCNQQRFSNSPKDSSTALFCSGQLLGSSQAETKRQAGVGDTLQSLSAESMVGGEDGSWEVAI